MSSNDDKRTKEEKHAEKLERLLDRYQLAELDEKDFSILNQIVTDLTGNNSFKVGLPIRFYNAEEEAKVIYLSALVEQNWIMIRQLDRLNKNIQKLSENK